MYDKKNQLGPFLQVAGGKIANLRWPLDCRRNRSELII